MQRMSWEARAANELVSEAEGLFRPHLEAIRASVRAGFRFLHLPDPSKVLAVQGFRVAHGAMDVYLTRSTDDALAARFRLEDLEYGSPPALWHRHGAVAGVVTALLKLPAHGTPGAPSLARSSAADLWIPGSALS